MMRLAFSLSLVACAAAAAPSSTAPSARDADARLIVLTLVGEPRLRRYFPRRRRRRALRYWVHGLFELKGDGRRLTRARYPNADVEVAQVCRAPAAASVPLVDTAAGGASCCCCCC